jgi:hypothetical protein
LGVSVQNFTLLDGCADIFRPFIWSRVSDFLQFRKLHQIASEDAALSRIITVDEIWIYSYVPETKQQSSQWKVQTHRDQIGEKQSHEHAHNFL